MPRPLPALLLLASACAEALPGDYFEVRLKSSGDACNDPAVQSDETWTYRLVTQGEQAVVYIDDAVLASGSILGCNLTYRSTVRTERREGGEVVRWSLEGSALVAAGEGCDAGDGWVGTEQITIVSSSKSDGLTPGCTYDLTAEGTYLETVE